MTDFDTVLTTKSFHSFGIHYTETAWKSELWRLESGRRYKDIKRESQTTTYAVCTWWLCWRCIRARSDAGTSAANSSESRNSRSIS